MRMRALMGGIGGGGVAVSSTWEPRTRSRSCLSPRRRLNGSEDMDNRDNDSIDGRLERAKDRALGAHDSHPSKGDQAGEAVGGIGGVLAGAAVGSLAGPVGTVIGGIAGALGGWWSGRAVAEATEALSSDDDEYYRGVYEGRADRPADRSFDDVRPAFYLGHVAAQNPDYANRSWSDVQQDLSRGWSDDH